MATVYNFTSSFTIVNTASPPLSHYALKLLKWALNIALLIFITPPKNKRKAKKLEIQSLIPELRSILLDRPEETLVLLVA